MDDNFISRNLNQSILNFILFPKRSKHVTDRFPFYNTVKLGSQEVTFHYKALHAAIYSALLYQCYLSSQKTRLENINASCASFPV